MSLAEEGLQASRKRGRSLASIASTNLAAYLIAMARYDEAYGPTRGAVELVAREPQRFATIAWALQHLAAIAALRPSEDIDRSRSDFARAARVLGFVDARIAALGAPREFTEQQEYERVTTALRKVFRQGELEMLLLTGASMTDDR